MAGQLTAADFPVSPPQTARVAQEISSDMDSRYAPSSSPRLAIITGQPAAGKTAAIGRVNAELDTPGVVLDSDEIRLRHPQLPEIMAADPQRMDVLSNGPVGEWMGAAITHARESGYNAILENTLTNPGQLAVTAEEFHVAGYTVSVTALAVPEDVSRMGIVSRYLAALGGDEYPRWTREASHTGAYTSIPEGLPQISEHVDVIDVVTRDGGLLYSGTDGEQAAHVLVDYRDQPLSEDQQEQWTYDYLDAARQIPEHGLVTDSTRVVLGKLADTADTLVDRTELPGEHYVLHAATVDESPYTAAAVDIPDPFDVGDPFSRPDEKDADHSPTGESYGYDSADTPGASAAPNVDRDAGFEI